MLPASHRLRTRDEFSATVRRGRRAGRRTLVVHVLTSSGTDPARVGFVVSRSVGGSVVRHAVARRLRAQVGARLARIPAGTLVVVRALPPAATASSAVLGADLAAAFDRTLPPAPELGAAA